MMIKYRVLGEHILGAYYRLLWDFLEEVTFKQ